MKIRNRVRNLTTKEREGLLAAKKFVYTRWSIVTDNGHRWYCGDAPRCRRWLLKNGVVEMHYERVK